MPKALKEWQAFLDLKKTIDDFSECCPLLEMMAHKAMRPRHWERISTITSVTLDVESETFQLRQLMSAPLLPNKEDIEVGLNLLTYEFWNVGEKLSACKGKWLLSPQRDKNIAVCRKYLLIKSQARITLKEILKRHFWNSITVMVVVLLSCSSKLCSYCQKVLLIGIFGFGLENLVFLFNKPRISFEFFKRNLSMKIEHLSPRSDFKY